jgi:hypothetical protein
LFVMTPTRWLFAVTLPVAFASLLALTAFSSADAAPREKTTAEKTDAAAKDDAVTIENHAWGNYHWARTSNPFTLKIGDNVTNVWDPYLDTTIPEWSESDVLDATEVAGGTKPKNCRATKGHVEVCNAKYGNNGWLGIASIWVIAESHIYQATTKLNDTYFNKEQYDTTAWRNLVMCQEVGHTFGLDHQDENFENENLGTCMDYTNDPESNQQPNQHDYDQLGTIYDHLDGSTTITQTSTSAENEPGDGPPEWGREISRSSDGRKSIFEKDLGKGKKKLTHVLWTLEKAVQLRGKNKPKDEHQEDEQTQQQQQQQGQ